jgi:hypothetical protein
MSDFKPRAPSVRGVIKDLCSQCHGLGTAAVEASRTLGNDGRVAIGYLRGDCPECSGTGWIIEITETVDVADGTDLCIVCINRLCVRPTGKVPCRGQHCECRLCGGALRSH